MLPVMLTEVRAALLVPLLLLKYIQCPWFKWQEARVPSSVGEGRDWI